MRRSEIERTSGGEARRLWSGSQMPAAGALTTLATLIVLFFAVGSAEAFSQRGHEFAFAFGSAGEGDGQFAFGAPSAGTVPSGISVDEATGDVYVVDPGNHRIDEFDGEGRFISAWGWGVKDGKAEYEVCTSGCRAGIAGPGRGAFSEPAQIAVDNSPTGSGTVYVGTKVRSKKPYVEAFSATGESALGRLKVEEEGELDGLAVDDTGTVWVYRGEEAETGVIEGFRGGVKGTRVEPTIGAAFECAKPGFAVDGAGMRFVTGHELPDGEDECPAVVERERREEKLPAEGALLRPVVAGEQEGEEAVRRELGRQSILGVAMDEASSSATPLGEAANGDVYLGVGTSVEVFDPEGHLVQRLGEGTLRDATGVAVDSATGDLYVVDAGSGKVDVFAPEAAQAPSVSDLSAQDLSPSEAQLSAQVDPNGSDTHYYFQYGTADCVAEPSACTDLPGPPGTDLGSGFATVTVTAKLTGLSPATAYHYRLVAANAGGGKEGSEIQETFDTLPASEGMLADGRAWELVSPSEKDGSGIEPFEREGSLIRAAQDGEAVTYVANGPVNGQPAGNRSPEPTQVLSTRSATGWAAQDLTTPHEEGEGIEAGEPSEYRAFSEDLALGVAEPPGGKTQRLERPPLAHGATEKTIYLRADPPLAPTADEQARYSEAQASEGFLAPGFVPLLTPAMVSAERSPGEKEPFGGQLNFLAATPDLTKAVFESEVPLLAGHGPGLFESEPGSSYPLVSVLPSGQDASSPALGDEGTNVRGALSNDGTRVIFSAEGQEGAAPGLYMRDTTNGQTLQLNAAQGVVEPTEEESEVDFQAATPDGSRVLFTDTAPLTAGSGQRQEHKADLYQCEIAEVAGKLTCKLSDLTPVASGGSADLLNVIPGASEDGNSVYFVANGVLAPGASEGHCVHQVQETAPPGATCNLYLWHEGTTRFIAALSNEDSGDWGSLHGPGRVGDVIENRPDLADLTARVSPDGQYLAFMSNMPLTGYDNTDANQPGVRDEEAYLFNAASGLITCVSCNTHGPSTGTHDIEQSGEGVGLLVDRRGDWSGAYLAGSIPGWTPLGLDHASDPPRDLFDSGRMFFDSPDPLVSAATNGKMDVYEFEPNGVGSCTRHEGCVSLISSGTAAQESTFLEASETGNDAFFLTAQPLVAADRDTNYDLYDARVCTGESPCLTSEEASQHPCETAADCKPPPTPQTSGPPPATAAYVGPGDPTPVGPKNEVQSNITSQKPKPKPLTNAQKLTRAIKACRTHYRHNPHRRAECERTARRRYDPPRKHTRANKSRRGGGR